MLRHCWEGLVVDHLPVVDYCLGCRACCFHLSLVDCWGQAGWDGFVVRTLVPTERVEEGGGLHRLYWWCIVDLWGWWCHKYGNFPHILLCWPSDGLSLLRWRRLCIRGCFSVLGHHYSILQSLVLVSNISGVAWLWCNGRWCWSRLWLLED